MNKLTNVDIVAKLLEIRNMENACNRAEALHAFTSIYKKTQFYKRTHKNLMMLYYEVSIEDLLTLRSLFVNLTKALNELDADHLLKMIDELNEKMTGEVTDIQSILNQFGFNPEDLLKKHKA